MKPSNCLAYALMLALSAPMAALAQDAPAAEPESAEASESAWSVEGSVDLVSDYMFRGISQTNEKPALQIGASVSHESGFYAGLWGSGVNYDDPGDGISTEMDFYVGWSHDMTDRLNLDLMANRYTYPGSNPGYGIDYTEYLGKLTLDETWFAGFGYANDYVKSGEAATYYQLGMDKAIGESGWTVHASAGHYDLQDVAGDSYDDFMLGISKTLGPVEISLSYTGTSGASEDIAPSAWTKDRLLAKISIPFAF